MPTSQIDKKIPADVFGVKEMGISQWQENFYWPVSDSEYRAAADRVLEVFDSVYGASAPEERDLLLSDTNFLFFLMEHLHTLMARERGLEESTEIRVSPLSRPIYDPEWETLSGRTGVERLGEKKWEYRARRVLKHLRFGEGLSWPARIIGPFRNGPVWSIGTHSRLKSEYARAKGLHCDYQYPSTLPGIGNGFMQGEASSALLNAAGEIITRVARMMKEEFGVGFPVDRAVSCWKDRLKSLSGLYHRVLDLKKWPQLLLLTEVAEPVHKVIAVALRRKGTRVAGFHHGNDMCNAWEKTSAYLESAHCDEFVCPTEMAARFHKKEYELAGISRFNPVSFVSAESRFYCDVFRTSGTSPFPSQVHSAMIVGYPMGAIRCHHSSGDFALFQLDVELRIAKLLRESGLKVIYKMHPERQREAADLFEGACDLILTEPFEKVWDQADALIFCTTTSTTFGYALCTNRPMYVLDMKEKDWNQAIYGLLSRRCVMIPAGFDARNRIQFDEKVLLNRITSRQEMPDYGYVTELMFPRHSQPAASPSAAVRSEVHA